MILIKTTKKVAKFIMMKTIYSGIREIGKKVKIGRNVDLINRRNIYLGDRVSIGKYCLLSTNKEKSSIKIGSDTAIHPFCILRAEAGFADMGNECSLNPYSIILAGQGGVKIGNYVRIASHTAIIAFQHLFQRLDVPICHQGVESKGIIIEDDVWIGANCTILDGVKIGKSSIIAAGAVVTKDVLPCSIMIGSPAKLIRIRSNGQRT